MLFRRLPLLLFGSLFPVLLVAQANLLDRLRLDSTRTKRLRLADSLLAARYHRLTYDTLYLARPSLDITIKVRMNVSGNSIRTRGKYEDFSIANNMETDHNLSTSIGISYRGISLGLSLNPGKLSGSNHNTELNLSIYNNRYGIEASYQDARDYHGTTIIDDASTDFPSDVVSSKLLNLNAYYVFNHRRFSFPAAFTQSYLQRRSAGSWMLALSGFGGEILAHRSETIQIPDVVLRIGDIGLGGGYGFNWVLPRRWMLHGSAVTTLVCGSFNRLTIDGQRQNVPYVFPEFILTERFSALHYFNDRHFVALTFVMNNTFSGHVGGQHMSYDHWRLRVCYGFRFSLSKN
jgi:hypothetical protein